MRVVTVSPAFCAGRGVIAGNHLLVTALLQRHEGVAGHGKPGVAAANWLAPELTWRLGLPITGQRRAFNNAVTLAAPVFEEVGCRLRSKLDRRHFGRRMCLALGLQYIVRLRIPPEANDRDHVAREFDIGYLPGEG